MRQRATAPHRSASLRAAHALTLALALTSLTPPPLHAQPASERGADTGADTGEQLLEGPRPDYLGVRPGINNYAPGKRPAPKAGQQVITWVGFQAKGDRARVFIQTDSPPIYEVASSDPNRVVIDLPSATLHTPNEARDLDTGFFPTVVRSVKARQLGKGLVRVEVRLREPARYRMKKEAGFIHLYFDPPRAPIDVLAERERELEAAAPKEGSAERLRFVPSAAAGAAGSASEGAQGAAGTLAPSGAEGAGQ